MRKCFIDTPHTCMWINRGPDRATTLGKFWQTMRVIADALDSADSSVVQAYLVLAGAAMPHRHRTLAAVTQIIPQRHLMHARGPTIMRQRNFCHYFLGGFEPSMICRTMNSSGPLPSSPPPSFVVGAPQPRSSSALFASRRTLSLCAFSASPAILFTAASVWARAKDRKCAGALAT